MVKEVKLRGKALIRNPLLNKGTGFNESERDLFGLNGLLPPHIETIEEQSERCYDAYQMKTSPLEKHIYLRAQQDRNETLFYHFILDHLEEMMPIIYTPVVGDACQQFHKIYRTPRGLTLSYPLKDKIDQILAEVAAVRDIRVIVVTDGERILGLGDQGAGGLGIPIGKLSLYTACGGIDPEYTLPVVLDVGTNNQSRIDDPEYLGWRHARVTGKDYDEFVDLFVQGVKKHFPGVLLQFEDFAQQHANPLLQRYRDQLCCFNDDIQGTAAVAVAAIVAATKVLNSQLKDHRVAVLGAGSAGCGISEQMVQVMIDQGLSEAEARSRFYLVDRYGLLTDRLTGLLPFQEPLAQSSQKISQWSVANPDAITLAEVIANAKPTILLGVSGQPQQFTEAMIKNMADYCDRPIIFPLSNPTSRAEALPEDLLHWTEGRALVATGSPFNPVNYKGVEIPIAQCNNSYIFPGVGLAIVAGKIRRVTDKMMMAAAIALSDFAPAVREGKGKLLPELKTIRTVSKGIAFAVMKQAILDQVMEKMDDEGIKKAIDQTMWEPEYQEYKLDGI